MFGTLLAGLYGQKETSMRAFAIFLTSFVVNQLWALPTASLRTEVTKSGQSALEQNCTPVSFMDQIFDESPHHQGDSKFCYAVVTADILSAKLNLPISSLDVALQVVQGNPDSLNKGSSFKEAVSQMKSGACVSDQEVMSLDQAFKELDKASISSRAELIKKVAALKNLKCSREKVDHFSVQSMTSSDFSIESGGSYKRERELFLDRVDRLIGDKKLLAVSYYSDDCVFCTPGFHVVSLVERYVNQQTGQCTYVLRNSYGRYDKKENYFGVFAKDGYIHMPRSVAIDEFFKVQFIE